MYVLHEHVNGDWKLLTEATSLASAKFKADQHPTRVRVMRVKYERVYQTKKKKEPSKIERPCPVCGCLVPPRMKVCTKSCGEVQRRLTQLKRRQGANT